MFSHEHRRPLYAFGVVALVAALVAGNGLRAQAVSVLVAAQAPEPLIEALAPDMVLGEHLTRVVSGEAAAEPSERRNAKMRRSTAPQAAPTTAPAAANVAPVRTEGRETDRPEPARKKPARKKPGHDKPVKQRSQQARVSPSGAARSGAVAATPARPVARPGHSLDTHLGRGHAKRHINGHVRGARVAMAHPRHGKGHAKRHARGKHARSHGAHLRGHSAHRGR